MSHERVLKYEKLTKDLEEALRTHDQFESREETKKREEVLGKLNKIIKQWVFDTCLKQGMSEQLAKDAIAGNMIYTFGSFRLGVHSPGSDIDTLCIGPRNIKRDEDFFDVLGEILREHPEVTELVCVPGAFVPIITFNFSTVPIDLVYAQLAESVVMPGLDLSTDSIMNSIDEKSKLSLNGCRVTDSILRLVSNTETFRLALRAIKFWAKRRFLYSNKLGFLGGVSWALLVAKVCQQYPTAPPSQLICFFFMVWHMWDWNIPVAINKIKKSGNNMAGVMQIITPSFPQQNSTHNVTQSTLYQMKKEFEISRAITTDIDKGEATWEALFVKREFFTEYRLYVRIMVSATTTEAMRTWEPFVESRVRKLIENLERTIGVKYAVPISATFKDPNGPEINSNCFLGLILEEPQTTKTTIDLSSSVLIFLNNVKGNPLYQDEQMNIDVSWVKRKAIPDFCFPNGRPKRSRKRRVRPPVDNEPKKQATEENVNESSTIVGSPGENNAEDSAQNTDTQVEETVVDIPVVPQLQEIEGSEQWNNTAATQTIVKPKVTLMARKI